MSDVTDSNDPEVIRRQIDQTRADLAGNVDLLEEKVSPSRIVDRRVGRAKAAAGGLRDSVMGKVHSGSGQAADSAHGAADAVRSAASSTSDAVTGAPDAVSRQTQGNPLAAGMIAFGVGWLLGSLFAPSDRERDLAAQAKEQAQPALSDAAQRVADEVRGPAEEAVADLKESATQAAQELTDEAKGHASDVKQEAQGAAEDVKDSARS